MSKFRAVLTGPVRNISMGRGAADAQRPSQLARLDAAPGPDFAPGRWVAWAVVLATGTAVVRRVLVRVRTCHQHPPTGRDLANFELRSTPGPPLTGVG